MHSEDSPAHRVQEAFTHLLRWAHRGDVRRSLFGAAEAALSTNDITLLRAVTTHGPVRASDLASWQGVDKSTITPQVRRLEDRGLIERQGDPGDKRAALLTATDEGRRQLATLDDQGALLFAQALHDWPAADQHALATLMQRLADGLADVPERSALHVRPRVQPRA
ncbi:MarR family winged helix-turn-helix transcriptional regulator [Actinoplanes sp. GCM10030250]|uniref:MarR family winged helix-turn-helix transcriptional regulator n=1 Tax=Actinoplanes sp. GCM10030250 TaxID=3273376 RepID=UPI0036108108